MTAAGLAPRVSNYERLPERGTSAGGGYSTVEDLLKFANALQSHKLFDARHTELLWTGKAAPPGQDNSKYAYGFSESFEDGKRSVGHGGGFPGVNGELQIHLDRGYTVAVLANYDPPTATRVARYISLRLP